MADFINSWECCGERASVISTRTGTIVRRVRHCAVCNTRWVTLEIDELDYQRTVAFIHAMELFEKESKTPVKGPRAPISPLQREALERGRRSRCQPSSSSQSSSGQSQPSDPQS